MDDQPKWRFACSECGILDERHRPETCPLCGDEVLDLENGSDQIFLYELFKQHRGRRWLR